MEKFKVFSMLADCIVHEGTKQQCEDFVKEHKAHDSNGENAMYVLKAN